MIAGGRETAAKVLECCGQTDRGIGRVSLKEFATEVDGFLRRSDRGRVLSGFREVAS